MFLQPIERVKPGDVLARTICDELGRPLLREGTALTERYLASLAARGQSSVYIRDGLADDVAPEDLVTERVRATVTTHVSETFKRVGSVALERGFGRGEGVDGAVEGLGEQELDLGNDGKDLVAQLYDDIETLLNELLESDTAAGLESLKTHNDYTFQHSVDVAVVGILIGSRLGMPRPRLRELALGCLLHDIGKLYIDTAILDKPGALTPEEFAAIEEHPRMGYELVRRMPVASLLPAHVAYQHHERQSGSGYPRGLVGDNRISTRLTHERIGAGKMLLIAEIAAVADVYSAVSSDRPYRAAMPPDQVMDTMAEMAGRHLNREVFEYLTYLIPRYPVGRWVEVTTGEHTGWRGVVTRLHATRIDRPMVRLHLDADGEAITSPRELDLRQDPTIDVRCLPTGTEPSDLNVRPEPTRR